MRVRALLFGAVIGAFFGISNYELAAQLPVPAEEAAQGFGRISRRGPLTDARKRGDRQSPHLRVDEHLPCMLIVGRPICSDQTYLL
jgi:hypothetical protein